MPSNIWSFVTAGTNPRIPTRRKTTPKRTAIDLIILSFSFVEGGYLSGGVGGSQACNCYGIVVAALLSPRAGNLLARECTRPHTPYLAQRQIAASLRGN